MAVRSGVGGGGGALDSQVVTGALTMSAIEVDPTGVQVLVVDDIRLSRDGLVEFLERAPGIVAAVGAPDAEVARQLLRGRGFQVVLVSMAAADSIAICRDLVAAAEGARVIAFAVSGTEDEVVACAEAGVSGYLLREQPPAELIDVVSRVARGETYCPPRVAAALMRRVGTRSVERQASIGPGRLTRRESEILDLIEQGRSNKEIARMLCIEVRTVKNHVHNLLEKFQVHRRGDAAAILRASYPATG
jgi:two-component system, NarL family, nitrate/nitrite response regulator NarL